LFRIDRNLVNLSVARYVQVDTDTKDAEVGAVGAALDAMTSAAAMVHGQSQKILLEAEAAAKMRAESIIEDARNEATALIDSAQEQIEEDRRNAWQEGFAVGAQEGKREHDEALEAQLRENNEKLAAKLREIDESVAAKSRGDDEKFAAKLREDDEKLGRIIGELYEERTRTYDALEDEIIGLALDIVRKIINPSGEEFGDTFQTLIKNALRQMNPDGKIVIRVSLTDYERFFPSGGAVFELDSGVTVTASILKDTLLGTGDCIIDADDTTINAGFDSQMKYVQLAFNKLKVDTI